MVQSTAKLSSRRRKIVRLERATAGGGIGPVVSGMCKEGKEPVRRVERFLGAIWAKSPVAGLGRPPEAEDEVLQTSKSPVAAIVFFERLIELRFTEVRPQSRRH